MADLKPIVVKVDGKEVTQTYRQIAQEVSSLKRQQKDLVVGTVEYIENAKNLAIAEKKMAAVKEEAKKTADALKGFDLSKFGEAGGLLQRVKNQFTDLKGGVGSAVQSFGLLKTAIAGTGIGLLVIAFTTLVAWFQKTDDGAKKLDGIMRGIGATVDILTNLLFKAGEMLIKTFSSPRKAMNDLYEFVKTNLINRFTAFGVILDGIINLDFKKVADGVIQAGTGISGATDKAKALAGAMGNVAGQIKGAVQNSFDLAEAADKLDDQRRKTERETAQNEKVINQLLLQAKNRTTSDMERIALLDRAAKLETANHKMKLDYNAAETRLVEEELVQKIRAAATEKELRGKTSKELLKLAIDEKIAKGTLSDSELDKYNQVLIAKQNLDQESIAVQEKITNRSDALEARHIEKKRKANEKRAQSDAKALEKVKEIQEAEIAAIQKKQDIEAQLIADDTKRKEKQLELQRDREIEAVEHSKATTEKKIDLILALEKKFDVDLAKIQDDANKAQKESSEKAAKEDLELRKRQAQARADLEVALAQKAVNGANKSGDADAKIAAEKALLEAQIAQIQSRAQFEIESTQATETEKRLIITQSQNQIDQLREQSAQADRQRNAQTAANIIGGFQTAFSAIADFGAIEGQKELKRVERDKAARLKSLDDEFKKGKISKEAYEKSKANIEQGFNEQTRAIKRQQAEEQKKWAIAQAIMQGAVAVISASANPLGIWSPQAIATAIMAGINVAKVIATPVPEFAKGGMIPTGPSHANGGLKLVDPAGNVAGEIEGGEPILSKATYANNKALVDMLLDSSVNKQGASIAIDPRVFQTMRFETGGVLPGKSNATVPSTEVGFESSSMSQTQLLILSEISRKLDGLNASIQSIDPLLKSYVVITEVGEELDKLRQIKREASGDSIDGTTIDFTPFGIRKAPVTLNDKLFS